VGTDSLEQTPVSAFRGVGPRLAEKLARLDIHTARDVLFHLPLRYQDFTRLTPIGALQPGTEVVIEGRVMGCDIALGRRRSLVCRIQDSTGTATLRFFHFSNSQHQALRNAGKVRCFGEARRGSSGLELFHPKYNVLDNGAAAPLEESLTPVYPTTEGVGQAAWQKLASQALALLNNKTEQEYLPAGLTGVENISLGEALRFLHHPPPNAPTEDIASGRHPVQQRLIIEELLAHHLSLLMLREQNRQQGAPVLTRQQALIEKLQESLPFQLTTAQQRVVGELLADLEQPHPMLRLVQGDVGSGKTVVAALAALQAVANDYQVAIMAPTEILAEQHDQAFRQWLAPLGIKTSLLTGKMKAAGRSAALEAMESGEAQLVVGTHALFQDAVSFARLGLIIIDEQHRFGVHQRLSLGDKARLKGLQPHQLIMTATPIPRTLAMSAYADLDCSVIDELPPGRTPVNTLVIGNRQRDRVLERVNQACQQGRQAYWVCTLVEESDVLQCEAAEATAAMLAEKLGQLQVGLVHGRMKATEKTTVMNAFKGGTIDLLVATTVIEVGVDVPNASLMVIENPERLGLSQLHQLRGRIGRGDTASHCVLMYQDPLSHQARQRLETIRDNNDGFVIAEKDLELRGPGEMLGTRQTGLMQLKIADLVRDSYLLDDVKARATTLLQSNPGQAKAIMNRWLGHAFRYANA
jgi:ATP-dependent DNA helicase RecG